jgi:hypothetical protein
VCIKRQSRLISSRLGARVLHAHLMREVLKCPSRGNQDAINRQSKGNPEAALVALRRARMYQVLAISMPSVCHQYAISMQSVCNQ